MDTVELQLAIEAKVEFVTDITKDRQRKYNIGEREVETILLLSNYLEYKPGRWKYYEN